MAFWATSSEAIAAARSAESSHGLGSPEAMLAWETAEEVAAAESRSSIMGGLDENCDLDSDACQEYHEKMSELELLIKSQRPVFEKMKNLGAQIRAMPDSVKTVSPPSSSGPHLGSYAGMALAKAIGEAKAASSKFGASSPEAAYAWDVVEELSASDNAAAVQPSLSEECLVDMMEACAALEELQAKVLRDGGSPNY